MSCRKEHSLQLTHLFIKALFLIFIFSSCAKEEFYLPENPQPIPDQTPSIEIGNPYFSLEKNKQESSVNTELQNVMEVLTMEKLVRDLTLNTLYATYFYPQLRGLTGTPTADTRTGCPTSTLSTVSGVHTMTLDYDACSTLSNATYDGMITVVITGDLDVNCTTIDIMLSDDFMVDDGDLDGDISLKYEDNGSTNGYNITGLFLSNTSSFGDVTIVETGPSGQGGKIRVVEVGTNSGPLDFIDDNFTYEEAMLEIQCPDGTGLTSMILTPISFNILCGIPQDGSIQLSNSFDGSAYAEIDFAHGDFSTPTGSCDNLVAVYLDSDPTTLVQVIID